MIFWSPSAKASVMAAKLKEFVRLVKGARGKLESIDEDEDTDSASPKSFEQDILRSKWALDRVCGWMEAKPS